jgi:sugar/nucleoside kinase (ribokinase family)
VLHIIGQFSGIGKVVLGLNENEALKVYAALHSVNTTEGDSIKELQKVGLLNFARCIFEKLTIDQLLIHPVDRSVVITKEAQIEVEGRVVRKPRILTGGGDNLNAGFFFGLLSGFSVEECMLTGMAASGAYVKNGFSPSIPDLITYLKAARRSK